MILKNFNILSNSSPEEELEEQGCFPQLSYTERLMGFVMCSLLGFLIQIFSVGTTLFGALTLNPTKFALTYSLGNIISLAGSAFLIGFRAQFEKMNQKDRQQSSALYVGSLILTLITSFFCYNTFLILLFLIIQILSYYWYIISYIPYARNFIKKLIF